MPVNKDQKCRKELGPINTILRLRRSWRMPKALARLSDKQLRQQIDIRNGFQV